MLPATSSLTSRLILLALVHQQETGFDDAPVRWQSGAPIACWNCVGIEPVFLQKPKHVLAELNIALIRQSFS